MSHRVSCLASRYDWDSPVKDILPEFQLETDFLSHHVTLRDLLTHRTGIPGHFVALMAGYSQELSTQEYIRYRYAENDENDCMICIDAFLKLVQN